MDAVALSAGAAVARLRAEATRGVHGGGRRGRPGRIGAGGPVGTVAAQLGCSERHLRRIVARELGVTPVELIQSSRLLAAKQLLTETALPITTIAFAAGFASLRRFNALFLERYRMAPTSLRRAANSAPARRALRGSVPPGAATLRLTLAYRPPLAWTELLSFLKAHRIPGVERVDENSYIRTVAINGRRGWCRVTHDQPRHRLCVEISDALAPVAAAVLVRIRALFDLDARPDIIDLHLGRDPRLADEVKRHPGLRVPGAFDGFELVWRTILGQQVSVRAATTISGRLAASFGEPLHGDALDIGGASWFKTALTAASTHLSTADVPPRNATAERDGLDYFTPTVDRLALATEEELQRVGLTRSRARTLHAFAALMRSSRVALEPGVPLDAVAPELRRSFGIGPWTIDYLAMRALRCPDAFPSTDLILARAIGATCSKDVDRTTATWRPWRAYAAMHLWRASKGNP